MKYYKAVKENDGTYTIRYGFEVVLAGVRGCNVQRTLERLNYEV
jgi:hypothetical protein